MFGYITINKDELKIKDYKKYQSYYCGVCHSLREEYGLVGQITLTYDMTFLAVLLSALYEDETAAVKHRCVPHPFVKRDAIQNKYTNYAAGMNIMLSYYKLKDDWDDEKSIKSNAVATALKHAYKKACRQYPNQAFIIEKYIRNQKKIEKSGENNIELIADCTGEMLGNLFIMIEDEWKERLYKMGFFLGKFIYILDAYDDLPKDIKKNNFNPFIGYANDKSLEDICRNMLVTLASECSIAFESLPILDNSDILRNILYAGIWSRFNKINQEKLEQEKHDK